MTVLHRGYSQAQWRVSGGYTRQAILSICHIRYYVILIPWVSALLHSTALQARGKMSWGAGGGLAHVRRVGAVGTASLQQHNHMYLGTKAFSQSVCQSTVRPSAQGHLASRSNIRHSGQLCFSGRDLGTFWPGIGRDEPPCRIQSVIWCVWYLVLHTHPRRPRYYVVHGLRAPGFLHTLTPSSGRATRRVANPVDQCTATPCQVPRGRHSIVPRSLF